MLQAVKPYYSPEDIEKGTRWNEEISKELESSAFGILCLTSECLESPWMMFEAGALSKNLEKSKVCPILFGVDASELKGPLVAFQASKFSRDEVRKIISGLNKELGDQSLTQSVLDKVFDKWWPELDSEVQGILSRRTDEQEPPRREERDLLEEILARVRKMDSVTARRSIPRAFYRDFLITFGRMVDVAYDLPPEPPVLEQMQSLAEYFEYMVERLDMGSSVTHELGEVIEKLDTIKSRATAEDDIPF